MPVPVESAHRAQGTPPEQFERDGRYAHGASALHCCQPQPVMQQERICFWRAQTVMQYSDGGRALGAGGGTQQRPGSGARSSTAEDGRPLSPHFPQGRVGENGGMVRDACDGSGVPPVNGPVILAESGEGGGGTRPHSGRQTVQMVLGA
ncbi:hypothetical protein GCM10023220_00260 [Streptomyces ziwulingensis]|uniref:Uncharacterized protein n=1 Tax=Streptomyces ziwulingensis TaxID=1045501 RepID=A0ABP9AIQ5_9ACTN